jgi:hypothetical protein
MDPRGWLPSGSPSHLHQTSIVGADINALCVRRGVDKGGLCRRSRGRKVTKIFEVSLGFGTTSECGDSGGDRAEAGGFGRLYARP